MTFILRPRVLVAVAAAFLLGQAAPAQAQQGWGTIKGQVVWGEAAIPKMADANVDKDKAQCLAKGAIKTNDLIIDPKSKGVRYVLVYLQDLKNSKNASFAPPIHPSLKNFKKEVEIDQPCCTFEPRMVGLREGQTLVVKNSMTIPHNFKIDSGTAGPNLNGLIPPNGKLNVDKFVAKAIPTPYSCSVHTWMKGWIGVFKHPYFAITDKDGNFEIKNAPAGKFRLVYWHEKAGWVVLKGANRGEIVTIEKDKTATLNPVKLTLPKD